MENIVEYWQSGTECTVPWMAHQPIHGALWWFTASNSAIFCFRYSKVQLKPETKKTGTVN